MPGVLGIVQRTSGQDAKPIFERLLASMRHSHRLYIEKRVALSAQWALGRVHLGIAQPDSQLAGDGPVQALFHGDLYNEAELRQSLQEQDCSQPGKGVASLIAALYQFYGSRFPSRLQGTFCTAVLDERAKRLVLASDLLGSYPLYWSNGPHHFIFASELKTVLCDPAVKPVLEPRALADYLTFGFLLGAKTLAKQVQLLPSASILTFCWNDGSCTIERYWRLEQAFQPWEGSHAEYVETLRQAFNGAVQKALSGGQDYGVSLSGGLDSRAILSAIDCVQTPISTYTLGVKGCADEVIAEKLSRLAGTKHRFFELDKRYLGEFLVNLRKMVSLTDGMYLSHGLTEMLALQFLEDANFSVLLRGHGGELAKASLAWPLHTDEHIHRMHSKEEFVPYLLQRLNYISRSVALCELFTEEWYQQMEGAARSSLDESVAEVHLSPADLCSYLYLEEQHRRFTIPSLELFRTLFEVRLPFVDTDLLAVLFHAPASWRDGTEIHRAIIGTNHPALLRVRNSNTGAPASAGPFLETIFDKINSLGKRFNLNGYRHYHDFEGWMKQMLVESVEKVLLSPDSLSRRMYRELTLRQLLEETRQGIADHGYLLQILLILELWQQENL
jgi:asparagine synthase (glutamine-hydrolysing)